MQGGDTMNLTRAFYYEIVRTKFYGCVLQKMECYSWLAGGSVASWLALILDRAVLVRALAGNIALSWGLGVNPAIDKHPIQGGGEYIYSWSLHATETR